MLPHAAESHVPVTAVLGRAHRRQFAEQNWEKLAIPTWLGTCCFGECQLSAWGDQP
jgi:hypothetical protein